MAESGQMRRQIWLKQPMGPFEWDSRGEKTSARGDGWPRMGSNHKDRYKKGFYHRGQRWVYQQWWSQMVSDSDLQDNPANPPVSRSLCFSVPAMDSLVHHEVTSRCLAGPWTPPNFSFSGQLWLGRRILSFWRGWTTAATKKAAAKRLTKQQSWIAAQCHPGRSQACTQGEANSGLCQPTCFCSNISNVCEARGLIL